MSDLFTAKITKNHSQKFFPELCVSFKYNFMSNIYDLRLSGFFVRFTFWRRQAFDIKLMHVLFLIFAQICWQKSGSSCKRLLDCSANICHALTYFSCHFSCCTLQLSLRRSLSQTPKSTMHRPPRISHSINKIIHTRDHLFLFLNCEMSANGVSWKWNCIFGRLRWRGEEENFSGKRIEKKGF